MSYTLEQKAVAYVENTLWWRFPDNQDSDHRRWTRVADDIAQIMTRELQDDKAEYFIGPTHPRVLSELEGELLEALNELLIDMRLAQTNMRAAAKRDPAWEGCAEAIQPRVDAAIAAIKKAESTP